MAIDAIKLDIPGSSFRVGIESQFNDYAVRRHLVTGETTGALAQDALHTELGGSWATHHVIPNLPLQYEDIRKFGLNKWYVTQVFSREKGSPWRGGDGGDGKRQELRFTLHAVPCFIRSDATRTNGLPYVADPDHTDFYLLPRMWLDTSSSSSIMQTPNLPPVSYMMERPALRLTDQRTFDAYPLSAAQVAMLGKVNDASIVLNSVGLTFAAYECRFVGADFVMESDGTDDDGRWAGAYYFDCIKGGHYMQRAYWSDADSEWKVANSLLYESGDMSIF